MEFLITNIENQILATSMVEPQLIADLILCNKETELLKCEYYKKMKRQGCITLKKYKLFLVCFDETITNKIFKHYLTLFKSIGTEIVSSIDILKAKESRKTRRLKHNLINHNSNILQELYKLFSQDQFKNGANHLDVIQSVIGKDTRKSAYTFLKVLKNSNLMKAEFDVYEMLDQESPYLDFTEHPIHKVVILTLNPFWLDLVEKFVTISIQPFNEKIIIDYKTISVSLSHIFDNATKYILPNSDFKISFENSSDYITIRFDMISLKVEANEIENIFIENISGYWSKENDLAGDGVGMYMINKLIKLNKGTVKFINDYSNSGEMKYNNLPFENNRIEIVLKR